MKRSSFLKRIAAGAAALVAVPAIATEMVDDPAFCKGWKDGYDEGWRDVKGIFTLVPDPPLCPLPEIGRDDYKRGFARGFKRGQKDARV